MHLTHRLLLLSVYTLHVCSCSSGNSPEDTVRAAVRHALRENTAELGELLSGSVLQSYSRQLLGASPPRAVSVFLAGIPKDAADIELYFTRAIVQPQHRKRVSFFHGYMRSGRQEYTGMQSWTLERIAGRYRIVSL